MAKVQMTIAEALKNHAVISSVQINDKRGTYCIDGHDWSYFVLYDEDPYFIRPAITENTDCEVELTDIEDIQIKIGELQKRILQIRLLKAKHGVAE